MRDLRPFARRPSSCHPSTPHNRRRARHCPSTPWVTMASSARWTEIGTFAQPWAIPNNPGPFRQGLPEDRPHQGIRSWMRMLRLCVSCGLSVSSALARYYCRRGNHHRCLSWDIRPGETTGRRDAVRMAGDTADAARRAGSFAQDRFLPIEQFAAEIGNCRGFMKTSSGAGR